MQHMYTVIIPSAKIANVARCVAAIRLHQPDTPIIDAFLYEYWWRTQRPGEQTHKTLTT